MTPDDRLSAAGWERVCGYGSDQMWSRAGRPPVLRERALVHVLEAERDARLDVSPEDAALILACMDDGIQTDATIEAESRMYSALQAHAAKVSR